MKETAIYFEFERVHSRSKNSGTFDATVELESLIENGASVIVNDKSQKSTSFGRKEISGKGKRKSARPKFISVQ